jgi:signal transduction histidine kinase
VTGDQNNAYRGKAAFWNRIARLLPGVDKDLRESEQLQAFVRAMPFDYCGWNDSGVQAISSGFAALFGADGIKTFDDILKFLPDADAKKLSQAFAALKMQQARLDIVVQPKNLQKTIRIFGGRGESAAGEVFTVLWALDMSDVTAAAATAAQAVARAEAREAEWLNLLNAAPFPLWLRGSSLDMIWCNKTYARIADDTAAGVIAGQKDIPFTGTKRTESTQRVLAQAALAQQKAQSQRGHVIHEGQRRLFDVVEMPLPQGRGILGYALDVTREEDWMLSFDRLTKSQREMMEHLRTAIAMFDRDAKLEFYNAAYEQMTGLAGTWLDSKPRLVDIIDKLRELRKIPEQADFKQYKQQWQNRITSLIEPHEEMQYLPDGSVVRMVIVPRPMGGLLVTQEDVTGRLQLETSYNTLIAVQRETMDNLVEAVAVFGEDGRLRLSNEAFSRLWRLPTEKLSDQPHITGVLESMRIFFKDGEWGGIRNSMLENALERNPKKDRLYREDGSVLEYAVMPLPDGNILNAYVDITDTVKVEQALMEKNAALEEAERLKTDFLANVSYQLRTPLNAILGFAELLHHQFFGTLNERQLGYTTNMIEAGQRLVSLVNDILDLSTIEAGYLKIYPVEIHLRALLEQVTHLVQEWARKQKLEMVIECPDEILLFGDERRIKQVLLNLISNAINYSPGGGRLVLSATSGADGIVLCVVDSGIGIPKAEIEKVFTPFEKIRSRKVNQRSGAGLGLALVKSIMQLHGGTVTIESTEGQGTTVRCSFPPFARAVQLLAARMDRS